MSQSSSSNSPENQPTDFFSNLRNQPFHRLQQLLLFQDSAYRSLFSYFLEHPAIAEPSATAEPDSPSNPSTSQSHTSSDRRKSPRPYLFHNLPTPATKEDFFMSNALNNLGNNGLFLTNGHTDSTAASTDNSMPIPLCYFMQNGHIADTTSDSQSTNPDKNALNDPRESTPSLEEWAQMQADLKQLGEVQIQQAATVQALQAENQTLSTDNRTLRSRINELHARGEAQDKMLADYRGGLRAIETAFRSFKLDQSVRMDGFEQTYQTDKIQTGRRQQTKDQQTEARLQSLIDPMLAEAVEKAIRLLRLDGRPTPIPAQQPSTPPLDHLYNDQVYKQNRTD